MATSHLVSVSRLPRIFAYLLFTLILASASQPDLYLRVWMLGLLVYPLVIAKILARCESKRVAYYSLLVDGLLVGLLISLFDSNLEVSVVLASLLSISALVIGGPIGWVSILPMTLIGVLAGNLVHPVKVVGGENFYFVSFACLLAYVIFIGSMVFEETRRLKLERKLARNATNELERFRDGIAPFVPQQLAREVSRRVTEGERLSRKHLTLFFSDIQGFAHLMDSMDEMQVAAMLNSYFASMTTIAHRYGGTLDKFIGDGVMVFFGDPETRGMREDALSCVRMALEMQGRFRELSDNWQSETGRPLHLRIGIHSGYCLVGDFGCDERRDYTALGSTVNLASRLEGQANPDEILISGATRRLIGTELIVNPRGLLTLKGFRREVTAYSVSGLFGDTNPETSV